MNPPPFIYLFAAIVLALSVYEVWTIRVGKPSISGRIWKAGKDWPPLLLFTGLGVGLLLGHFFFGQCGPW